jgi:hypothetical protein
MRRPGPIIGAALALLVLGAGLVVVGVLRVGPADRSDASAPPPTAAASTPSGDCGGMASLWDCAQSQRFGTATEFVNRQKGHLNVEIRDRRTGAVWRAGETDARIWAGSTPKLAFAVALLEQARAGQITLDATATKQMSQMLLVSDNTAAETLWNRYAHPAELMTRFVTVYGMKTAGYVTGFPNRWGFVKCTSSDLASLMAYILDKLDPDDRRYIVDSMRQVGPVQHWGVWGAGAALRPGVKDGWSIEKDDGQDHWITATVGFAGPDERYIVAAMYHQLPGGDTIDHGVHVLTDLVATIFGAPVPAPVVIPPDY